MRRVLVPLDLPPAVRMPAPQDALVHALGGETMGTTWSVKFVAPSGCRLQPIQDSIERVLDRIVAQMSTWIAVSDISRFNRAEPGTWCDLPEEFFEVLQYSLCTWRIRPAAHSIRRWGHWSTCGDLVRQVRATAARTARRCSLREAATGS